MTDIKFIIWNCSGILPSTSSQKKVDFLFTSTNFNFDVMILVETHHHAINDIQSSFHTYSNSYHIVHTAADKDDSYAGIIVLIHKNFTISSEIVLIPDRLLNIKIKDARNED